MHFLQLKKINNLVVGNRKKRKITKNDSDERIIIFAALGTPSSVVTTFFVHENPLNLTFLPVSFIHGARASPVDSSRSLRP